MQTCTPDRPSLSRPARPPLIVFSHVRWSFVHQRPQHLLTRLAAWFDVHVVEEPVFADAEPALMSATHQNGVEVLTPRTKEFASGFHDSQLAALRPLIADFMASRGLQEPLVWLTTPLALPLVADLEPRAVVYDCMDDVASPRVALPGLAARDKALMALADIVLTGGPSLHESRQGQHSNLHCLPGAVDAAHFAPEHLDGDDVESSVAAELHRGMPRPRLGFFGVVDERLDAELVAAIADRRPGWQVVIVGPVVGRDPAALPRRPNLRWAGLQRHEALPHLMSHWDVCLLPFARSEATRLLHPSQTLEYLAGGKPVVGTPVPDLVSLHADVVRIAEDADGFVAAIDDLLAEPAPARAEWRARARALVDARSWDRNADIVAAMLLEFAPSAPALPTVLHEPLAGSTPLVTTQDDPAAIALPVERVEHPAPSLPM
ncbi:glycosyltransferase [Scleromatobacter humisilvae]|uniref:Glycosyltransferase n=1 Tax=Scleromatobacter humisilvae TaxID=2897159 RepID=A0A9X1YS49_9BURK|nr:glycosyltransferase [Scleromatobacter humisilvae]MCK9687876.1 glycosyltransferase [Scleromatobacter humisilvae]